MKYLTETEFKKLSHKEKWDYLVTLEPYLDNLLNLVNCMNPTKEPMDKYIYYTVIKPQLLFLVGWDRVYNYPPLPPRFISLKNIKNEPDEKFPKSRTLQISNPASTCKSKLLWTSTAWDAAFHVIDCTMDGIDPFV